MVNEDRKVIKRILIVQAPASMAITDVLKREQPDSMVQTNMGQTRLATAHEEHHDGCYLIGNGKLWRLYDRGPIVKMNINN